MQEITTTLTKKFQLLQKIIQVRRQKAHRQADIMNHKKSRFKIEILKELKFRTSKQTKETMISINKP